ncbi:unnamed protein product [Diatraea saccharalis]|uniref:Peroxidase n=1 Tax=Diatraea saccharalis TaxID=40085 RepID=A0A9N9R158_9NEOP|nr:unnamed protein product [Diatraea saccharalis]
MSSPHETWLSQQGLPPERSYSKCVFTFPRQSVMITDRRAEQLAHGGLLNLFAAQELKARQALSDDELALGLTEHTDGPFCPPAPICPSPPNRYRSFGGECNNPSFPTWGAVHTGFERLLPPDYSDGGILPSARAVSNALILDGGHPSPILNLMFMQFGQFIAHDTSSGTVFTIGNGSALTCCTPNGEDFLPQEFQHWGCAPIASGPADDFYGQFHHQCLNFVRAQLAPASDCSVGYAKQMNGATHYPDLSHLYGTSDEKVAQLRGPGGLLKTFNDYGRELPPLTERKECAQTVQTFGLSPSPGYCSSYDHLVNPSLTAEFSTAAMRFGHSVVDGKLTIPDVRRDNVYESIFIPELTRYLFHGGNPFGIDLAAINIQRGRDYGVRSYNQYRRLIGLEPFNSFNQFAPNTAQRLASIYESPEDIDLWVGGLLEEPVEGSVVGITFGHILADQFSRIKRGDRYFYENGPDVNPGAFTPSQLAEIKKVTLSRIICDNKDGIELFAQPPNAFVLGNLPGNEPVPCESLAIPAMDLSRFKEI